MEKTEEIMLKLTVSRLVRLGLLQSSALMNLSTSILRIDGIPEESKTEAFAVFSGIQEQLDVLKEIQDREFGDGI